MLSSLSSRHEFGFTLVELMVVVLIIGILVSIATPIYVEARVMAESRTCQSNQRNITGAIALAESMGEDLTSASSGVLQAGGSGWYVLLVPQWLARTPYCPTSGALYSLDAAGTITGDQTKVLGFKAGHRVE